MLPTCTCMYVSGANGRTLYNSGYVALVLAKSSLIMPPTYTGKVSSYRICYSILAGMVIAMT